MAGLGQKTGGGSVQLIPDYKKTSLISQGLLLLVGGQETAGSFVKLKVCNQRNVLPGQARQWVQAGSQSPRLHTQSDKKLAVVGLTTRFNRNIIQHLIRGMKYSS